MIKLLRIIMMLVQALTMILSNYTGVSNDVLIKDVLNELFIRVFLHHEEFSEQIDIVFIYFITKYRKSFTKTRLVN